LGQVYPSLADREFVRLRQLSGCRQIALVKGHKYLCGSNLGHTKRKAMLAHRLAGLIQNSGRTSHISLGEFQAGEECFTDDGLITHLLLSRQLHALLPVTLSSVQVVPLVEYTGQAEIRFGSQCQWMLRNRA